MGSGGLSGWLCECCVGLFRMGLEQNGATELSEAQSRKDYWKDGFCAATNTTQNDLADQLVSR